MGLLVAFLVLTLSHSAQPALLYLVPSTLLPVLLVATIRRELRSFLNIKQVRLDHFVVPLSVCVFEHSDYA